MQQAEPTFDSDDESANELTKTVTRVVKKPANDEHFLLSIPKATTESTIRSQNPGKKWVEHINAQLSDFKHHREQQILPAVDKSESIQ